MLVLHGRAQVIPGKVVASILVLCPSRIPRGSSPT
jgi:hypothetical protein